MYIWRVWTFWCSSSYGQPSGLVPGSDGGAQGVPGAGGGEETGQDAPTLLLQKVHAGVPGYR